MSSWLDFLYGGEGGGGNPGYTVTTQTITIAETQSVTTEQDGDVAFGSYVQTDIPLDRPATLNVIFNGTEYTVNLVYDEDWDEWLYGDTTFTDTPFILYISTQRLPDNNVLATAEAGTYTFACTAAIPDATVTDDFKAAVKSAGTTLPFVISPTADLDEGNNNITIEQNADDVFELAENGVQILFRVAFSGVLNAPVVPLYLDLPNLEGYLSSTTTVVYDRNKPGLYDVDVNIDRYGAGACYLHPITL